ncbi:hypothetical protein HBH82_096820 [Parastagonospora nodorum]|nr:hypothetical protein HBH82_096820 [Parastagonospora nodorum]KAH4673680.1 hypothetical protein HBH78_167260 [Parastagonospora nodorum]KAH4708073.1 hypothetical protein HBH67_074340 [Parastagonospora nodorum]KAH4759840.1 hypothetical protein HBH63_218600 [Parastagonospora nodorum]KAH4781074.1 hypothetical protein HBH62_122740 [Parastagonospora nodorum]
MMPTKIMYQYHAIYVKLGVEDDVSGHARGGNKAAAAKEASNCRHSTVAAILQRSEAFVQRRLTMIASALGSLAATAGRRNILVCSANQINDPDTDTEAIDHTCYQNSHPTT